MDFLIEVNMNGYSERRIIRVNDKLIQRKKRIIYQPLNAGKYVRY